MADTLSWYTRVSYSCAGNVVVISSCFCGAHVCVVSSRVVSTFYVMIVFLVIRDRSIQSRFRSFDLAVLPQNNNQYFVCTDLASIRVARKPL